VVIHMMAVFASFILTTFTRMLLVGATITFSAVIVTPASTVFVPSSNASFVFSSDAPTIIISESISSSSSSSSSNATKVRPTVTYSDLRPAANASRESRRRTASVPRCQGKRCGALKRTRRPNGLLRALLTVDLALRKVAHAARGARDRSVIIARHAHRACLAAKGHAVLAWDQSRHTARVLAVSARESWRRTLVTAEAAWRDPRVQGRVEQVRQAAELGVRHSVQGARAAGRWVRTAGAAARTILLDAVMAGIKAAHQAHDSDSGSKGSKGGSGSSGRSGRSSRSSRPGQRGSTNREHRREHRREHAVPSAAASEAATDVAGTAEQRREIARILALPEAQHYETLGLSERSSLPKIKSKFRTIARLLHPDKCKIPQAHEAFLRLQAAHAVLTDHTKRLEYDRERALGSWFANPPYNPYASSNQNYGSGGAAYGGAGGYARSWSGGGQRSF
jgi:hypothetical protein